MELIALTFASGWASGLNAYATVLALGLLGRFAGVTAIPEGLQRTDVLVVMAVLVVVEFVADKIPYFDSAWDAISTVIRPLAGATIGALVAGASGELPAIALAAVGGLTALLTHLAKAGIRLAANTSPEPVSNIGLSVTEDVAAVSVTSLAVAFPIAAAAIAGTLLIAMLVLGGFLLNRIVNGWQALRRRFARP
jgi:hypothetical protein